LFPKGYSYSDHSRPPFNHSYIKPNVKIMISRVIIQKLKVTEGLYASLKG